MAVRSWQARITIQSKKGAWDLEGELGSALAANRRDGICSTASPAREAGADVGGRMVLGCMRAHVARAWHMRPGHMGPQHMPLL